MRIDKPDPRIGAIATDVDVRSLSDSDWNALYRAWLDGIVLVVRGQTLTIEEFLAYSRRFGRLKPHRVKKTRHPEHAELTVMGLALCGIGMGAFTPSNSALASKQSTGHDRGSVMGTYQSSSSLARVIGPFASGPLYAVLGSKAPFLAGACVALPAVWFLWRVRQRLQLSHPQPAPER